MRITIECGCGNKLSIPAPANKYTQFRDYLETQQFHYEGGKITNEKMKEFVIHCGKCKKRITLGVD